MVVDAYYSSVAFIGAFDVLYPVFSGSAFYLYLVLMAGVSFVSVVIPTYNEAENIAATVDRTVASLLPSEAGYEILIVDDASPDRTAAAAAFALRGRGRVIQRHASKRSLSLSVLDGIRESRGDVIVVMDGDGNHPPELIPFLVNKIREGYDLAIASRYVKGGSSRERLSRRIISRFACCVGRVVTGIRDNTSGFFCVRKSRLGMARLAPVGFKIGLEIFVKSGINSVCEVPFTFMSRAKGRSKFGLRETALYFCHIGKLLFYKIKSGLLTTLPDVIVKARR